MKTNKQMIDEILKLEAKARKLEMQLWETKMLWKGKRAEVDALCPLAWQASCEARGVVTNYTIEDCLC